MADEATIRISLQIEKGNLQYRSYPTTFQADVIGTKGPTPGALTIPVAGEEVSLAELITPGFCLIHNLDTANYVEYGIYDTETDVFFPLGEVLPEEFYLLRLSRNLLEQYAGTGTGTTAPTNKFWMKANTAPVVVEVLVFER